MLKKYIIAVVLGLVMFFALIPAYEVLSGQSIIGQPHYKIVTVSTIKTDEHGVEYACPMVKQPNGNYYLDSDKVINLETECTRYQP